MLPGDVLAPILSLKGLLLRVSVAEQMTAAQLQPGKVYIGEGSVTSTLGGRQSCPDINLL